MFNFFASSSKAQLSQKNPTFQSQSSPSDKAPNFIFGVSAKLIASRLCCSDIVVAEFPYRYGNSYPFNITWNDAGRIGSSIGLVSATGVSGGFTSGVVAAETLNPFWKGLFEETSVAVFVKRKPLTVYNFSQSITGNMRVIASTPNAGADVYINELSGNASNTPLNYNNQLNLLNQPLTNCSTFFEDYPGVPYCYARTVQINSGTLAINGSGVVTDITGTTNGNFEISASLSDVKPVLVEHIKDQAVPDKLKIDYYLESSTGNINDLAGLQIRECLKPPWFKAAPWSDGVGLNLKDKWTICDNVFSATLDPFNSNRFTFKDEHSHAFALEYSRWSNFITQQNIIEIPQRYQWKIGDSGWKDLDGASFVINKKVFAVDQGFVRSWYSTITKHGDSSTIFVFHESRR